MTKTTQSTKTMLAFSFFDQYAAAIITARSFGSVKYRQHVVLGLETEQPRTVSGVSRAVREAKKAWPAGRVFVWDQHDTKTLLRSWNPMLPFPFFAKYSYGSAVNRLFALAKREECEFLVRIDPGTQPIGDFASVIDRHVAVLGGSVRVVSGQYTQRLAVRDEFVPVHLRPAYLDLIHECTGIDPRPGRQVTGGAAFTVSVDMGPPAIPFDHLAPDPKTKVMAWGSDDGFFQTQLGSMGALVDSRSFVKRADPGVNLSVAGYVDRLSNAVALREVQKGVSAPTEILASVTRFRERLREILAQHSSSVEAACKVGEMPPMSGLTVDSIRSGHRNYVRLVDQWPSVVAHFRKKAYRRDKS